MPTRENRKMDTWTETVHLLKRKKIWQNYLTKTEEKNEITQSALREERWTSFSHGRGSSTRIHWGYSTQHSRGKRQNKFQNANPFLSLFSQSVEAIHSRWRQQPEMPIDHNNLTPLHLMRMTTVEIRMMIMKLLMFMFLVSLFSSVLWPPIGVMYLVLFSPLWLDLMMDHIMLL